MSFEDYKSITHVTSNERDREEVVIHRHRTFIQWLFRKPASVETYEKYLGIWVNKATGKDLDTRRTNEIAIMLRRMRYLDSNQI